MHPGPKQGKSGRGGKGGALFPFLGHREANVSMFPLFNMIIQNCHGFGWSCTWHFWARYISFQAAYSFTSIILDLYVPSMLSSSFTL